MFCAYAVDRHEQSDPLRSNFEEVLQQSPGSRPTRAHPGWRVYEAANLEEVLQATTTYTVGKCSRFDHYRNGAVGLALARRFEVAWRTPLGFARVTCRSPRVRSLRSRPWA